MLVPFTTDEARVFHGFIDTTLRAKGIEALDAAWTFKMKFQEAAQQEQNEIIQRESKIASDKIITSMPADTASQLG